MIQTKISNNDGFVIPCTLIYFLTKRKKIGKFSSSFSFAMKKTSQIMFFIKQTIQDLDDDDDNVNILVLVYITVLKTISFFKTLVGCLFV